MLTPRKRNRQNPRAGSSRTNRCMRWCVALIVLIPGLFSMLPTATAQTLTLSTATGGLTIAGAGAAFTATFGNMNGLGAGTIPTGLTAVPMSNGTLYYTPINMRVSALGGAARSASVTGYVSTNAHTAALVGYACPYPLACTTSGNYSALSTSAAAPSTIITSLLQNSTVTVGVAFFLPDNDGATAYTGTSNVVFTFTIKNLTTLATKNVTFTMSTTVQTAVQLKLGTATGGATVVATGSTPDFTMAFGNVNALGIGPGTGFTTTTVAGGIVYHTPYTLNPAFSAFTSTTSSIKVYVSTNFAHPAVLTLDDSSATGGPYNAISTAVGAQTSLTTTAADRSSITRYLGLFVSNVNGATAYNGADSATLTFTLTVP